MEILNLGEHIRILEELLLHQDFRHSQEQLEALLAPEFREVDPRGNNVSRENVIRWLLAKDPGSRWEYADFEVRELGDNLVLATYFARQILPEAQSSGGARHCSLWRQQPGTTSWQLFFHQSTKVA
jgi:hypothetical protein